LWEKELLKVLI